MEKRSGPGAKRKTQYRDALPVLLLYVLSQGGLFVHGVEPGNRCVACDDSVRLASSCGGDCEKPAHGHHHHGHHASDCRACQSAHLLVVEEGLAVSHAIATLSVAEDGSDVCFRFTSLRRADRGPPGDDSTAA